MPTPDDKRLESVIKEMARAISKLIVLVVFLSITVFVLIISHITGIPKIFVKSNAPVEGSSVTKDINASTPETKVSIWIAPDTSGLVNEKNQAIIRYGRQLISNTAYYLGPKGKVAFMSNGMNCQNCHLNAGTKPFGNNYSAVASTYPKFRERSGGIENIYKRVNDCFERSLNGQA